MKSCSINFKIFSDKSSFTSMKIISFNTRRDYNDATNVLILFFKFVKVEENNTRLNYSTSTQAVSPQTLMYWYSLTKTVSFRFGQTQQPLNRSGAVGEETTHILALHLLFHDMFMRAPVEGVSASRLM